MKTATFISLLFPDADAAADCQPEPPAYFGDLNLDQIVAGIVGEQDPYELRPLFQTPVADLDTVTRRHAVFQDFEKPELRQAVKAFTDGLQEVHSAWGRIERVHYRHENSRWLVDGLAGYCRVVADFATALSVAAPSSKGFCEFAAYLSRYVAGDEFRVLREATAARLDELNTIRYSVLINHLHVEVTRFDDEVDYGASIAAIFERFRRDAGVERPRQVATAHELNQVETRVLVQVVKLFPEVFARLDDYVARYADYIDPVVARIDRELRFFLYYQHYIEPLKANGLAFCYPQLVPPNEPLAAIQAVDLALAKERVSAGREVICNDVELTPPERLMVVSGPNQGGKTTFARMLGQLHYLARLGLPVPASRAALLFWRQLFTHFERAEDIYSLRGKLEDDLVRVHAILGQVDEASIVIMNEIFASTTTEDARYLGERVLRQLLDVGAVGLCVTFIDELARLDDAIVSMASRVDAVDPAIRTFKVMRHAADGKAYARSLAAKHGLTREQLEARL